MQEMPLFVCATGRGWTVASVNGRPKGPFVTAGQAVSFAVRAFARLRARGRHAWVVMEQPEIVERELAVPHGKRPLAAMPATDCAAVQAGEMR